MFGMLRCDGSEKIEFVASEKKTPGNDHPGRGRLDFACKACREKKVRCTAQRSGCDRCKANNISCIYSNRQSSSNLVSKRNVNTSRPKPRKSVDDTDNEERDTSSPGSKPRENGQNNTLSISGENVATNDFAVSLPTSPNFDDLSSQMLQDFTTSDNDFDSMLDIDHPMLGQSSATNVSEYPDLDMMMNFSFDAQSDKAISPDTLSFLMNTPPDSSHGNDTLCQTQPTLDTLSALSYTTPTSAITTSSSASNQRSNSIGSVDSCGCLQMLATILERLIMTKMSTISQQQGHSLDLELAFHKAALARCDNVIRCSCYGTRPEHVMMLIVVCERIVEMCDGLVMKYRTQLEQREGFYSMCRQQSAQSTASLNRTTYGVNTGDHTPPQSVSSSSRTSLSSLGHTSPTAVTPLNLNVGSFHVSSVNEWAAVMRAVIVLQLQSTKDLVERMTTLTISGRGDKRRKLHHDLTTKMKDRLSSMLKMM